MNTTYNHNNIKKNKDSLFWRFIESPIVYVIGCTIIFAVLVTSIKLTWAPNYKTNQKEIEKLRYQRWDVANRFIKFNNSSVGEIDNQWEDGSFYYVHTNKGTYRFLFNGVDVFHITYTSKSGLVKDIY